MPTACRPKPCRASSAQNGCVGVRAYYGLDEAGQPQLVLVGYDANDNDILPPPPAPESRSVTDEMPTAELRADDMPGLEPTVSLATNFPPCPPCCSIENPLNS